jgi:uncharacterized protein YbcI
VSERLLRDGELALAISTAVVRELASTTGRGPMRAKTTLGDNAVFVVLQDTLTRGEQNLVDAGQSDAVLSLRRLWQKVMRTSCSRAIEDLTGRKVVGFMSDNHIDPDIAVEVFILEASARDRAIRPPSSSNDQARP